MSRPKYNYDPACEKLADHFLDPDGPYPPDARKELAQVIQDAIEGWFDALAEKAATP